MVNELLPDVHRRVMELPYGLVSVLSSHTQPTQPRTACKADIHPWQDAGTLIFTISTR